MEITQALINKFLQNRCSPSEVDAVVTYFLENQEALEKYMSKVEWDAITVEDNLNTDISQKILLSLKKQLFKKKVAKVVAIPKISVTCIVTAASVIMVVATSWWYIQKAENTRNTIAAVSNITATPMVKTMPNNNWQIKINTSKNSMIVRLQDGSTVTLFKNSAIKYPQPFIGNIREIVLSGDAFFEVAKNKLKPFIVYSGNLSTTALGTSFRITAFKEGKANINVKLFTGKVVIKSTQKTVNWKKDVFLSPGEELAYNPQNENVIVSKFNTGKAAIAKVSIDYKKNQPGNELKFNNASLMEVMKEMSTLYNIKICYTNTDLEQMNFTGVINQSDNIQAILKVITQMNSLELIQTSDGFTVNKPPK